MIQVSATPPGASGFAQTVRAPNSDAIKVTLQDCLACSGCITSAETVLLQHQSTDELLQKLQDPSITVIATLSPQSRASLAEAYGLDLREVRLVPCTLPCLPCTRCTHHPPPAHWLRVYARPVHFRKGYSLSRLSYGSSLQAPPTAGAGAFTRATAAAGVSRQRRPAP